MRKFAEMGRQRDAAKKKKKNKGDSNASLRAGIPLMRHERSKKNSAILSQTIIAAKLVKI